MLNSLTLKTIKCKHTDLNMASSLGQDFKKIIKTLRKMLKLFQIEF